MGESSDSMIQVLSDTKKGPGDKITYQLRMQLSGAGIAGDSTLEGNEEALTVYTDSVLIDQLRHAVRSGGKMTEQRIPFSIREEARMGLTDWWTDRIDQAIVNQLAGVTTQADLRYTGQNATIASSSGNIVYPLANEASEVSISTTSLFNLAVIDRAVAKAKTMSPVIRPIMVNGTGHYVMHIHPHQTLSLRTSTTTGLWQDIQKFSMAGSTAKDNPIFTGALGVYNNVILKENHRLPAITTASSGTGRRAIFCGAQAATMAVGQNSNPEKMSWVEELFDYENQLGVSAGMIFGVKKTVFNSADFGVIVCPTTTVAP